MLGSAGARSVAHVVATSVARDVSLEKVPRTAHRVATGVTIAVDRRGARRTRPRPPRRTGRLAYSRA